MAAKFTKLCLLFIAFTLLMIACGEKNDEAKTDSIDKIIAAKDRKSLISATKALDRVLLLGYYVVPHWHIQYFRIAYWDKFGRPKKNPKYDLGLDTWWIDINKVKLLETTEK